MTPGLSLYDVAIVGGGASGTLTALNLLRLARSPLRIGLWDAFGRFGLGVAYSTVDPGHRLNVPAKGMSAWADHPAHFIDWLRESDPALDGGHFAARERYGAYLQALLSAASDSAEPGVSLTLHREEMGPASVGATGVAGTFESGRGWRARSLVLATGNPLPADLRVPDDGIYGTSGYHRSPWSGQALSDLTSDAPVLLLGTGLTSVDVALSLRARGHRGPIHALSRHGQWPRVHAPFEPLSDGWQPPMGASLRGLFRAVRERIARAPSGSGWRAVIDGLRPHNQTLWQRLGDKEQRRFLRHLRPYWDVHRHRVAPEPGDLLEALRKEGAVLTHAGRLLAFRRGQGGGEIEAIYRPRGGAATTTLRVQRVINCTGPATLRTAAASPLSGWLAEGIGSLDAHGQGLRTDERGALLDTRGLALHPIFTLGPLRRGELWETTAVPEIRVQAEALARTLLGHLSST